MSLNEHEAIQTAIAVSTAMLNNDKPGREMLYADLDTDDLKRVLRWTVRMSLQRHMALCQITGLDPIEAWQEQSLAMIAAHAAKTEGGTHE